MFSPDQYAAAHAFAVMSAGSSRGALALTGADRLSFLHALLTNDIVALTKGRGTYAAYLTPQGRMISDMRVIETGDRVLLGIEAPLAAPLAERLGRLIFSEDVQVQDITGEVDEIGVHGPAAGEVVGRASGISMAGLLHPYDNVTAAWGPDRAEWATIVRDDAFGVPGFDIYLPRSGGIALRAALAEAGALEVGDGTLETLRIEAGRPRFGVDMSTETIPLEAGIEDRAISFTKGCYVGQEVIIRVMHRGHGRVARRLVRLILQGGAVPSRGDAVQSGSQSVGEVTSAVDSPRARAPMAMAYVHRDHAGPGAALTVNGSPAVVYEPRD